jgi:hypothetical protein
MTERNKIVLGWMLTIIGGLGGLTVVGMAAQYWISTEVSAQLLEHHEVDSHVEPKLKTNIEVMKTEISGIAADVDTALESQRRFEEIFMEYLREEASR